MSKWRLVLHHVDDGGNQTALQTEAEWDDSFRSTELQALAHDLISLLAAMSATGKCEPTPGQDILEYIENALERRWAYWGDDEDDCPNDECVDGWVETARGRMRCPDCASRAADGTPFMPGEDN